jgi:hypothetical protein
VTENAPHQEAHPVTSFADDDIVLRFGPAVDVADGVYPAQLIDLDSMTVEWDGEPSVRLRWTFAIEDGSDATVPAFTSTSTGDRSTARKYVTALLGPVGAETRELRKRDLIGRLCQVIIAHNDRGYPKVESVLAPKRAAK